MEKKEKVEYIEEQMRLCLECKDYIRVLILSRKINTATLNSEGFEDLKVRFYTLMNFYHAHEKNYLEIARGYQSIYNTPKIQADENDCKKVCAHKFPNCNIPLLTNCFIFNST
jgi:26S proteasome regulatory subunit N5